jgi:hypothetical protein
MLGIQSPTRRLERLRRLRETRMAETKTKPTDVSVDAFLDGVEHPVRRAVKSRPIATPPKAEASH